MTDYTASTGTSGSIIIRDNGSSVTFIITCSDPATNTGGLSWSGTVNGSTVGGTIALSAGFGSRTVATYPVSTTQTVTFSIGASGTSGLGGPRSVSAAINRASVPATPKTPTASNVQPDRMTINWTLPANGGAPLDQMLLRRSTSPTFSSYTDFVNSGSATSREVTGLTPGTTYYWRVYAHNSRGYSSASGTLTQATLAGGRAWDGTAWRNCRVRTWNGTAWQLCRVRQWDGTTWRTTR